MSGKQPKAHAISFLLRREGFAKAIPVSNGSSRRKGPGGSKILLGDGYRVTQDGDRVQVCFWVGHRQRSARDPGALMFYIEKIRAAGYDADYGDAMRTYVVVTAREED